MQGPRYHQQRVPAWLSYALTKQVLRQRIKGDGFAFARPEQNLIRYHVKLSNRDDPSHAEQ
jgi:hypothetical protein